MGAMGPLAARATARDEALGAAVSQHQDSKSVVGRGQPGRRGGTDGGWTAEGGRRSTAGRPVGRPAGGGASARGAMGGFGDGQVGAGRGGGPGRPRRQTSALAPRPLPPPFAWMQRTDHDSAAPCAYTPDSEARYPSRNCAQDLLMWSILSVDREPAQQTAAATMSPEEPA